MSQTSPSQQAASRSRRHFRRVAQGLFVSEPSGVFYTLFRSGGKLFRGSLGTTDEKTALRKLPKTQAELLKRNVTLARATFGEVTALWKETELAAKDLKPWSRIYRENCIKGLGRSWPTLAKTPVRKITVTDCERWLAARRDQISPGLLNNELGTLKMVLGYAVREGAITENPAAGLKRTKVPQPEIVIPSKAQFSAIVANLRERGSEAAANFVELLGFSGMRRHEAAELRWEDVDFQGGRFTVTGGEQGTKNRQVRRVPLFPAMRSLLERIRSERVVKPDHRVMTIHECHNSIVRACRRLKLPHMFTHHSLRHFFCSNAIEAGIDFKAIAGWLGHKDGGILVAKTYGHLREEHSEAMAAKMKFGTNPTPPSAALTQKDQGTR